MTYFLYTINRIYCCFYLFKFLKKEIYNIKSVERVDKKIKNLYKVKI